MARFAKGNLKRGGVNERSETEGAGGRTFSKNKHPDAEMEIGILEIEAFRSGI